MAVLLGLDVHCAQITFDALDHDTGEVQTGRVRPANRDTFVRFLARFDGAELVAAVEAMTGWRFVVEEMQRVGAEVHLAEPSETSAKRGPKRRAKTDRTPALISFNVEALALTHITEVATLAESLQLFFDKVARDIKSGLTEDPAGVSGKIKLPGGMTCERAAKRLRFFADKVQGALDHSDDRDAVESALADLYPEQLPHAERSAKSSLAEAIRRGDTGAVRTGLSIAPAATVKPARAYGDDAASA